MPEIFVRLSSKEAKPGSFVSGYQAINRYSFRDKRTVLPLTFYNVFH